MATISEKDDSGYNVTVMSREGTNGRAAGLPARQRRSFAPRQSSRGTLAFLEAKRPRSPRGAHLLW
ncbi:MAG TPA: hypothetical protein ENK07_09890 [Bacteroidetes bacterium]|nr:hypothetical protein [Bacteroidota bacterium]